MLWRKINKERLGGVGGGRWQWDGQEAPAEGLCAWRGGAVRHREPLAQGRGAWCGKHPQDRSRVRVGDAESLLCGGWSSGVPLAAVMIIAGRGAWQGQGDE